MAKPNRFAPKRQASDQSHSRLDAQRLYTERVLQVKGITLQLRVYWRECEIGGPRIRHDVDLSDTLGWILTLCIFEDHSSEKTHMIANMDAFYVRAVLTIVSAQDWSTQMLDC